MKKINFVLLFMAILLTFNVKVFAQTDKIRAGDYIIMNSQDMSNDDNLNITESTESNGVKFYAGSKLSDFIVTLNHKNSYGSYEKIKLSWETPNYVLKTGKQRINAVYGDYVYDIIIIAIDSPKVIDEIKNYQYVDYAHITFERYQGTSFEDAKPVMTFYLEVGNFIDGKITYDGAENFENLPLGKHDVYWTFVPTDSQYETKTGVLHFNIVSEDKNEGVYKSSNEKSSPSLTAHTLLMATDTTYNIDINDIEEDSTCTWSSSDTKVAKVNSKTGNVTAVSEGKAKITCKVTNKDKTSYSLTSDVTVGLDENLPELNSDDLQLSNGDKFDLNVNNRISGSKYRYVSSNKKLAIVGSTNGIVTARGEGNILVRCLVTTPSGKIIVLKCEVEITE